MRKITFMTKGKKIILAALFIAVVAFPSHSYSKEKKHGAELLIQKKDGQKIGGELLAVRENHLILMDSSSLSGVTLDIGEINSIQVVKKSKLFQGLEYGLLIGGGSGEFLGFMSGNDEPGWFSMTAGQKALLGAIGLGILGASLGGIWGAIKGIDESIEMEGRSTEEIMLILKKLNSSSRYPTELAEYINVRSLEIQKEALAADVRVIPAQVQTKAEDDLHLKSNLRKFSRIHLSLVPGYFNSQGIKDFKGLMENIGFGDDWFNSGGWFDSGSEIVEYPWVMKNPNGLGIDYKYIPIKLQAFQITSYYWYYDRPYPNELIHGSMRISIPGKKANFGGLGLGVNLGFHF